MQKATSHRYYLESIEFNLNLISIQKKKKKGNFIIFSGFVLQCFTHEA